MNTATLSAKIFFHGSFWIVAIGSDYHTCLNRTQLLEALSGRPPKHKEIAPPPTKETVEQFLARGGTITRVGRLTEPKPLPKPAKEQVVLAPSRITLESLGFFGPAKPKT